MSVSLNGLADRAAIAAPSEDLDSDNSEDREVLRSDAWAQAELTYGLLRPGADRVINIHRMPLYKWHLKGPHVGHHRSLPGVVSF